MKNYELTYLISPQLSEEEAKSFQEKIASLIKGEAGVLEDQLMPVKRNLAYTIKKQNQAYLAVLDFKLEPEKLSNLQKKLKEDSQIIRYLLITKRARPKEMIETIRRRPRRVVSEKEKKVELKEIEKKLEEILQ